MPTTENKLEKYHSILAKTERFFATYTIAELKEILSFMMSLNKNNINDKHFYYKKTDGESRKELERHGLYKTGKAYVEELKDLARSTDELFAYRNRNSTFWTVNFLNHLAKEMDEDMIVWAFNNLIYIDAKDEPRMYSTLSFSKKSGKIVSTHAFGG